MIRYGAIAMWALDFIRAARERPLALRLLLRPILGECAYREFIGLIDELEHNGFLLECGYGLESMEYHNQPVPWAWWVERINIPIIEKVVQVMVKEDG